MNRNYTILIVILVGIVVSLGFLSSYFQSQINTLEKANTELQDSLNTLPSVQTGKNFLDNINYTTGKIKSLNLEEKVSE